ncbi:MAG: ATP-binding protein [Anaerolineae bacterium]
MTADEIRALCKQGKKGPQVDLLQEKITARRLATSMVAMANADGGTIIVGLGKRRRSVEGLAHPEAARDKALEAATLSNPPLIIPLPEIVSLDEKKVLVIAIPAGLPHVYSLSGKYLIRAGTRNRAMSTQQLRRLLLERGEVSFESLSTAGATMEDLDQDKVERYLENVGGLTATDQEEILLKRGCLVEEDGVRRPTHAGLLLFGREPARFFKSCEIIAVRYAGREMGDEYVREDIRDTLPEQIRRAEAFVASNMRVGAHLVRLERQEKTEYPIEAVREAIVNAVAHRDYSIRGDEIRIVMFANRIEFYSPGRLPGHITVENIKDERFSRNEAIVQVLADLGYIERLGYGIDRMIRLMKDEDLPPPIFTETANGFKVTLYGHGHQLLTEEPDTSLWAHLTLNERQERALAFLLKNRRITNRQYRELCPEVSEETIRRDLADLVRKDLLLKIGDKRATYYIFK